jgi:hypothetical protein
MFDLVTIASYVVAASQALVILLTLHHSLVTAFIVGMALGAVPQGLAWGVAELIVPGWVIRLRQRLIAAVGDIRKPVGDYFSRVFATTGPEPWTTPVARNRVRIFGVGLTVFWIGCIAVLVWVPAYLDAFFGSITYMLR